MKVESGLLLIVPSEEVNPAREITHAPIVIGAVSRHGPFSHIGLCVQQPRDEQRQVGGVHDAVGVHVVRAYAPAL